jgi:Double zinc ribbon
MVGEAVAAALVGVLALFLVLRPLVAPPRRTAAPVEPLDPEETPKGVALTALKEIEFDRETGKLSDADYELLKRKYTAAALEALRAEERAVERGAGPLDVEAMIAARVTSLRLAPEGGPACPACGPRLEPEAAYCSSCGRRLPTATSCNRCGIQLSPDSRFCAGCGTRVAA